MLKKGCLEPLQLTFGMKGKCKIKIRLDKEIKVHPGAPQMLIFLVPDRENF